MPSMMLSVRTRLTLWHVTAMALILAVFSCGIYSYVRESLFVRVPKQRMDRRRP
jgi:hypothetical protein